MAHSSVSQLPTKHISRGLPKRNKIVYDIAKTLRKIFVCFIFQPFPYGRAGEPNYKRRVRYAVKQISKGSRLTRNGLGLTGDYIEYRILLYEPKRISDPNTH